MASSLLPPPSPTTSARRAFSRESDDEDADTASQRSISLSSPPLSKRNSVASSDPRRAFASHSSEGSDSSNRGSQLDLQLHNEKEDAATAFTRRIMESEDNEALAYEKSRSTIPLAIESTPKEFKPVTYPPSPPKLADDAISISSFASTSSRKARPESLLIRPTSDPLILGVALVDFNHLVRVINSFLAYFLLTKRGFA